MCGRTLRRLRNGIETAGAERTAAEEAANGEPQATTGAVELERFDCVAGAARGEPAGGGTALHRPLVPVHGGDQASTARARIRAISRLRSSRNASYDRCAAAGVTPMRYR